MVECSSRIPTFLLLGAAKCGTTSLAYYLSQHPDVCFSDPKEPIFFEAEYERGLDHYWQKYFQAWSGERAIGEGRPWNLYLPFVAPRIHESLPEARLIALLRDPVERVYSHWWHRYSRGQERLSFEAAMRADRDRIERGEDFEGEKGAQRWRQGLYGGSASTGHRVLLDLGFYAEQLERYLKLYRRSQVTVVFYEDLVDDLSGVMDRLFGFLGVESGVQVSDRSPQNVRPDRARGAGLRRLEFAAYASGLPRLVPKGLRARLRQLLRGRPRQRPPLSPAMRRELVAYYELHNERLEHLTGRDLSAWRDRGAV
jgi:hypothetical protein